MSASSSPLLMSRLDCDRIEALLESRPNDPAHDSLRDELARAQLREPQEMPDDVITMNSTARFIDEANGEEHEMTLVYPRDVSGGEGRVSILAPVGSALLGLRVGESIDWQVPGGRQLRLRVLGIRDQPEAAGDYHR